MRDAILTVNAGSSSIKLGVFCVDRDGVDADAAIHIEVSGVNDAQKLTVKNPTGETTSQDIQCDNPSSYEAAFATAFEAANESLASNRILAVGHRIVHGGRAFSAPVILNDKNFSALKKLSPLAPAHQPHNLRGVALATKKWPGTPQIACFDTAFHRTQSAMGERYALPDETVGDEIRRYGFHGLSYEFVWGEANRRIRNFSTDRTIIAHLGSGASMCGLLNGKSIATSMGFTPLDGLPMGTRSGAVDPGVLLYLLQEKSMSADEISEMLYKKSGLFGISGVSADMAVLESSDDLRADAAIEYFVDRASREIGSIAAALGGVDALIFTGGIGENSSLIREKIMDRCAWMGFELDADANKKGATQISMRERTPSAWVIPTNEELMIARHVYRLLDQQ